MTGDQKLNVIIQAVCNHYDLKERDLKTKSKERVYVEPRHVIYYFARSFTGLSFNEIGARFDAHHSTVIHGEKVIQGLVQFNGMGKLTVKVAEDIRENIKAFIKTERIKRTRLTPKELRIRNHYRIMHRKSRAFSKRKIELV